MENGSIVKEARKATGLSQSEFAGHLEIPVRTLQQWEQGRRNLQLLAKDLIDLPRKGLLALTTRRV